MGGLSPQTLEQQVRFISVSVFFQYSWELFILVVDLVSAGGSGVTGRLQLFHFDFPVRYVSISGYISGLKPGAHGFHIHATGDVGDDCKAAGGHFNPDGVIWRQHYTNF